MNVEIDNIEKHSNSNCVPLERSFLKTIDGQINSRELCPLALLFHQHRSRVSASSQTSSSHFTSQRAGSKTGTSSRLAPTLCWSGLA